MYFYSMADKTWTTFVEELEQKIFQSTTDGSWKTLSVSNIDGVSQSFSSMEELLKTLELAKAQAQIENGALNRSNYRPLRLRNRTSRV